MINSIKRWFIVKALEWAVDMAEKQNVMSRLVPVLIDKLDISKDVVKAQLISLLDDWRQEIQNV